MKKIFCDKGMQRLFERQGFVIVENLLDRSDVIKLTGLYEQMHPVVAGNFFTSTYSPDRNYRKRADAELKSILPAAFNRYLRDYKPVYGNFMVKKSVENSESELHQDWTFVDESNHTAVNVWCPLTEYEPESGFLRLVKFSQHLDTPYRGRNVPSRLQEIQDIIKQDFTTEICINPGAGVFFNTRTFHCSSSNTSGKTRVAVAMVMIPSESTPVHYRIKDGHPDQLEMFRVNEEFFTDFGVFDQMEGLDPVKDVPFTCEQISIEEFVESYQSRDNPSLFRRILTKLN